MSKGTADLHPTLAGATITLRPLRADDLEPLHAAASDPLIWAQHPDPARHLRPVFEKNFFAGALAGGLSGAIASASNPVSYTHLDVYKRHPLIWAQHPDPARHLRPVFEKNFFAGALAGCCLLYTSRCV